MGQILSNLPISLPRLNLSWISHVSLTKKQILHLQLLFLLLEEGKRNTPNHTSNQHSNLKPKLKTGLTFCQTKISKQKPPCLPRQTLPLQANALIKRKQPKI